MVVRRSLPIAPFCFLSNFRQEKGISKKILKSLKIRKTHEFMVFSKTLKILDLTEAHFSGLFEVAEYVTVAKIDLALFHAGLGVILTQNLSLTRERLFVGAHRWGHSVFLKFYERKGYFQKHFEILKNEENSRVNGF